MKVQIFRPVATETAPAPRPGGGRVRPRDFEPVPFASPDLALARLKSAIERLTFLPETRVADTN